MKKKQQKRLSWQYLLKRLQRKSFVLFFGLLLFYGLYSGVQIATATTGSYVPNPHSEVPDSLKQVFFLTLKDGEGKILPPKDDGIINHGPREKKQVALTYDADMTPWMREQLASGTVTSYYDRELIDILKATNTKATLFLSGLWIEAYEDETKELATNPLFELANHSYSHPSFTSDCYGLTPIEPIKKQEEVMRTQAQLLTITHKHNTLFRFPGGCYAEDDLRLLSQHGLKGIQWDSVGDDGFNESKESIVQNVLATVQNGSIIVLHMNGAPNEPMTAQATLEIIQILRDQGYVFVTVSELLAPEPKEEVSLLRDMYSLSKYSTI